MTIALDPATIFFVLQASYLAEAMALAYARYRSADAAGVELIAVGFLVLAAGALLAGYTEIDAAHYGVLSLSNVTLGISSYGLFLAGALQLSRRRPVRPRWIVLLPPLLTLAAGLTTGFHSVNWQRAVAFNATAALAMLAAAWAFYRGDKAEPLPARRIVALAFAAAGLISLMMAVEFATDRFWLSPILAFVFILALKIAIALSLIVLTMERTLVKLDRLAHTDMLAGLGNRRSFFAAVPASLQAGDAVVLFDADRFKKLNDSCGHAAGDDVLRAMARALSAHLREGDILARYGGEEFILFLPAAGEARALAIADAIRADVEAAIVLSDTAHPTLSAGIAAAPAAGTPLNHLIKSADAALYEAKAAGRNTCRVSRKTERGAGARMEAEPAPAA